MKITSHSLEETEKVARDFLKVLEKKGKAEDAQIAEIIGLSGDLGAGKTTFVQAVARTLGVKERVTSPTFVIMKSYHLAVRPLSDPEILSGRTAKWQKLIHIDAYRLESGEELMKLNFAEIAKEPKNLILIEWPDNVKSALPENYQKIYFKFIDENTHEIEF